MAHQMVALAGAVAALASIGAVDSIGGTDRFEIERVPQKNLAAPPWDCRPGAAQCSDSSSSRPPTPR